MQGPA